MKQRERLLFSWMLPIFYLIHLLEEFYAGIGLPAWLSNVFNAELSNQDFILINVFGLAIMILNALLTSFGKGKDLMLIALTTLLFMNGFIHLIASGLTWSYNPGVVSGTLVYIPLGFIFFKKKKAFSKENLIAGIFTGIVVHLGVTLTAMNI